MSVCAKPSGEEAKRCLPCEGGLPKLDPAVVTKRMASLPLWSLQEGGAKMRRSFVAKNFVEAMAFLNAVATIAEREGHHPDLHLTSYRNVEVEVYTHSVGGITENDLILAELIDGVPVVYSPKWLKEHPEAQHTAKA